MGVSDSVPDALLHQTTEAERRHVAGWLRERLPIGKSWSADYQRRAIGSFLLELEADDLDDDAYLRLCQETGRAMDLVDRLLKLGRLDEAMKVIKAADDHDLLPLADLLVRYGHAQEAEWLVEDRAGHAHGVRILDWLTRRALERGDKRGALKIVEQSFTHLPTIEKYGELRRLADKAWPSLRRNLLADLEERQNGSLLIDIYLHEKDVDRAIGVLNSDLGRRSHRDLAVAKAAEKTRPRVAIKLYCTAVETVIGRRGRESYKTACEYLRKVRTLYKRLKENGTWEKYIASLRSKYRALPALRKELAARNCSSTDPRLSGPSHLDSPHQTADGRDTIPTLP